MSVEATLLVDFGNAEVSSSTIAVIELDGEANGDKTSFAPGDIINLRLYYSSDVTLLDVVTTAGNIYYQRETSRTAEVIHTFASRDSDSPDTLQLTKIPSGGVSESYFGRSGALSSEQLSNHVMIMTADTGLTPFIAKLTYPYLCRLYQLYAPSVSLGTDESYPVSVVAYFSVNGAEEESCL